MISAMLAQSDNGRLANHSPNACSVSDRLFVPGNHNFSSIQLGFLRQIVLFEMFIANPLIFFLFKLVLSFRKFLYLVTIASLCAKVSTTGVGRHQGLFMNGKMHFSPSQFNSAK